MSENKDLQFIAGAYFDFEIPKEKRFLLKYFKGKIQVAFLKYYMVFNCRKNFVDHTGIQCAESLQKKLEKRYQDLLHLYDKSKLSFTEQGMQVMQIIESGKLKFTQVKNLAEMIDKGN